MPVFSPISQPVYKVQHKLVVTILAAVTFGFLAQVAHTFSYSVWAFAPSALSFAALNIFMLLNLFRPSDPESVWKPTLLHQAFLLAWLGIMLIMIMQWGFSLASRVVNVASLQYTPVLMVIAAILTATFHYLLVSNFTPRK